MARMSLSLFVGMLAACSSAMASDSSGRDAWSTQRVQDLCDQPMRTYCLLRLRHQDGLTGQKSPTLYFHAYAALPTFYSIRFTLIDSRSMRPLAEIPLQSSEHSGLQRVQLKDYGIELEPEIQYQWYISENWNSNLPIPEEIAGKMMKIAEGNIERIDSKHLKHHVRPCEREHVRILADAKFWYDAFACAIELVEANPDDITLRDLRDELLGKRRSPYDRMPLL